MTYSYFFIKFREIVYNYFLEIHIQINLYNTKDLYISYNIYFTMGYERNETISKSITNNHTTSNTTNKKGVAISYKKDYCKLCKNHICISGGDCIMGIGYQQKPLFIGTMAEYQKFTIRNKIKQFKLLVANLEKWY